MIRVKLILAHLNFVVHLNFVFFKTWILWDCFAALQCGRGSYSDLGEGLGLTGLGVRTWPALIGRGPWLTPV